MLEMLASVQQPQMRNSLLEVQSNPNPAVLSFLTEPRRRQLPLEVVAVLLEIGKPKVLKQFTRHPPMVL